MHVTATVSHARTPSARFQAIALDRFHLRLASEFPL
jgi:hypothetical protein